MEVLDRSQQEAFNSKALAEAAKDPWRMILPKATQVNMREEAMGTNQLMLTSANIGLFLVKYLGKKWLLTN